MMEKRDLQPCVLCGTMTQVVKEHSVTWRCECGRTQGCVLDEGALDLGISNYTLVGEPATLVDEIAKWDPQAVIRGLRGER